MIGFGESGVLGYFGGQALLYSKYNFQIKNIFRVLGK